GRTAEADRAYREALARQLRLESEGLTERLIMNWDLFLHYNLLARIIERVGRPDEAAEILERVREAPPAHIEPRGLAEMGRIAYDLALLLSRTDRPRDEERAWRRAVKLFGRMAELEAKPRWQRYLARCHSAFGDLLRRDGREHEADEQSRLAA